jgi:hypothetical protein
MRTHIIAVTALTGSMLLGPFMLAPSQAGRPDFVGATHARAVSAGVSAGGGAQASARPAGRHYTSPSDRGEPAWQGHEDQPYNRQFAINGGCYGYPWERYSLE